MVHGNYLTDDELKIVIDSGASVTITPGSRNPDEPRSAVNRPRARFGWKPSLGVDVESNISGDMFTLCVWRFSLRG